MTDELRDRYDVVVVGGGAAGLNGALVLARARRSVVVVDAGEPRNAPAEGVHGLLGHDGTPPAELLARGREEVMRYGGQVVRGSVAGAARDDDGFVVTLADGRSTRARRLLVTTGLVDALPDVPGVAEHWGHDVLHCPYCHGWEVQDQAIGVLGSGPQSVHQALLFRQWSDDVTYVTHTVPPDAEQAEQLAARGIEVVQGAAVALERDRGRLALRLDDGSAVTLQALVVAPRMVARAGFLADLGLRTEPHPTGVGEHVPTDPTGRTAVPGVFAAGNVSDLSAQVGGAAAAGAWAAAQLNGDLVTEETELAVRGRRAVSA
ncbi:NAD(P)/FAD-dependent oxidoreductase [Nocardioides caldifontis]|uniref:NAD(P)/FAD-dependent oxidoreductase n=1 Tax=Nocardioides caldifontis TaxID=2588938 RepID=UPI001EF0A40F|nr:NAD(P)/FAD-dependent oxidoreductase [Nocardioides caldifontis]